MDTAYSKLSTWWY